MSAVPDPRRQPDLYWKEMEQLKAASVCIRLCRNNLGRRVRAIEIVKAVASGGGIAGWVVWRDYPLLWSGIIAGAQLLDAIKDVFPFARQHKAASNLTVALETLFIDTQYEWERIYSGELSDADITKARRKMQKLRLEAENGNFPDGFEAPARLIQIAAQETRIYMTTTYGIDDPA